MDLLQGVTIAVLVLLAFAGTLMALQKRGWVRSTGSVGTPRRLETLERLPLTAQHSLHLVRVDDCVVVVSAGPGGCTLLEVKAGTR